MSDVNSMANAIVEQYKTLTGNYSISVEEYLLLRNQAISEIRSGLTTVSNTGNSKSEPVIKNEEPDNRDSKKNCEAYGKKLTQETVIPASGGIKMERTDIARNNTPKSKENLVEEGNKTEIITDAETEDIRSESNFMECINRIED